MSKAFKCDGCKRCFDPYAVKDPDWFVTIHGYIYQDGHQFETNEYGYAATDNVHLCPDCSKTFTALMANHKSVVDKRIQIDKEKAHDIGYDAGYEGGYNNGYEDGYDRGVEDGKELGYSECATAMAQALNRALACGRSGDRSNPLVGASKPGGCGGVSEGDGQAVERPERAEEDSQ